MLQMALRVFLSSNHQSFWFSMLQVLVSCCLGICPCLSGSQTCWCTVVPGDVSDLFPCEVCQFSFLSRAWFTGVTCSVLAEPKSGLVCLERQLWFASLWGALSFFLPLCSDLDFSPYLYTGRDGFSHLQLLERQWYVVLALRTFPMGAQLACYSLSLCYGFCWRLWDVVSPFSFVSGKKY